MKLIIHDLPEEQVKKLDAAEGDYVLVDCSVPAKNCIGCFGCWLRTPGQCVIRDVHGDMGKMLAQCSQLVIISRCSYGGFSPEVKTVMDRSISFLLPDFRIINNEMHHKLRYKNRISIKAYFYGDKITEREKETARHLIVANGVNLGAKVESVEFFSLPERIVRV